MAYHSLKSRVVHNVWPFFKMMHERLTLRVKHWSRCWKKGVDQKFVKNTRRSPFFPDVANVNVHSDLTE